MPPGQYELEMVIGYHSVRQQGQNPKMNVTVQGQSVLKDYVSPLSKEAASVKARVTVEAGKPLEVVFTPAAEGTEWGVNAMVLRPAR